MTDLISRQVVSNASNFMILPILQFALVAKPNPKEDDNEGQLQGIAVLKPI